MEILVAKLPMKIKFGVDPVTEFKNNLTAIKISLLQAPTMDELRSYLPQFAEATWSEQPDSNDNLTLRQKDKIIKDVFFGKTLPTALETINLNFRIEGISLQEVTHIIRHRNASFSADCSGDKWWTEKAALIPNSIENSNGTPIQHTNYQLNDFHSRYIQVVEDAKQLYCDMIDSKQISIMDARYILPRCLETFYYMRITLKDAIAFIKQRMDKQIQPETDNIIAYQMYLEILKQYPVANDLINLHAPSMFYVKTARTGKATNLYFPDADSDLFDWHPKDFIYQCQRNQMNGTDEDAENMFDKVAYSLELSLCAQEQKNEYDLIHLYMEEDAKCQQ